MNKDNKDLEMLSEVPMPIKRLFPTIDSVNKFDIKVATDPLFAFKMIKICENCF